METDFTVFLMHCCTVLWDFFILSRPPYALMSTYPDSLPFGLHKGQWPYVSHRDLSVKLSMLPDITALSRTQSHVSLKKHHCFVTFDCPLHVHTRGNKRCLRVDLQYIQKRHLIACGENHGAERKNSSGLDASSVCDWMTICAHMCVHARVCAPSVSLWPHVRLLFKKRRDIWLYRVHLPKWSKWFEHWASEQTATTELTFAIFYRLSVYWKKEGKKERQSRLLNIHPRRANCHGNEHHTLGELQCPLSRCSGGWKRISSTVAHALARTHNKHRGGKKGRRAEEKQTCISGPPSTCKQNPWSR